MNSQAVTAYESKLGFPILPVLRQMFAQVGEIRGTQNGDLFSLSRAYEFYQEVHNQSEVGDTEWPHGLLPICDWGCSIYSSVWCLHPELPVVRNDGNQEYAELRHNLQTSGMIEQDHHGFFERYGQVFGTSWVEADALVTWLPVRDFRAAYP